MRFASQSALLSFGLLFGSAALGGTSASCSSSTATPGSSCDDYQPPAGFDATTPAVSFSKDVLPVFQASCAFSSCHGSTVGSANGVFLGNNAARVFAATVNVRGDELTTMPFVTPGDPRQSYLMRKMDGSQCALDAQCTGGSCLKSMPQNQDRLDDATRDKVRRWIAQGAKND